VRDFTVDGHPSATLLDLLERFYDAVPRRGAEAEPHGTLTLFVRRGAGWPYYARPTLGGPGPVTGPDITAVRRRQRELGVPEELEWVVETSPGVDRAAADAGLDVRLCPLLVLDRAPADPGPVPPGITVALVRPDDPDLAAVDAVAGIGFGASGTATGAEGPAARDAAARRTRPAHLASLRDRLASGEIVQAVARGADGPLAIGTYQHAEGVAEIVGVATLPAARRQGLGAAVTAVLARHARDAGLGVFLSAGDETVARVYERVGFRRVATAGLASAPATPSR
jgi:ribosomal protein S18 acetylase RimI-like enzyme